MGIQIADRSISVDEAVALCHRYADTLPGTLRVFDGVGTGAPRQEDPDRFTASDLGRLIVINADLQAQNAIDILAIDASTLLSAVPRDLRLADCEPNDAHWAAASTAYELLRGPKGVGRAKRSKLMHLKRPGFYVITDSVTGALYKSTADNIAASGPSLGTGFWSAVRSDVLQPEFVELMTNLQGHEMLGGLSRVRVLDIVAWQLGRKQPD